MSSRRSWTGRTRLTWSDIEKQVQILSKKVISTGFEFDKICTVTRGGLVPARLLADKFDIKVILVDQNQIPAKTLFVDDIYDSGKTCKKILPLVESPKNFVYATLVARKGMIYPRQLVYAQKTRGFEYVVFPWDRLEYSRMKKWFKT